MPIQLAFTDRFKRDNPQAYLVLTEGNWKRGSGGLQIKGSIYASKQLMEEGGDPLYEFDEFVPFDTGPMTGGIEQYIMAHDAMVAAGGPQQVTG
jgi:hypothetical protein